MLRKRTALFFLLLANLVLLAHAAVPHHHHNNQVCIPVSHPEKGSDVHKNCTASHKHEHDGNKNAECCVLKQVVVIHSSTFRHEFKIAGDADQHTFSDHFQALHSNKCSVIVVKGYLTALHTPLILSSFTDFIYFSQGLRAPPVA